MKHLPNVLALVGMIVMLALDERWARTHPGAASFFSRPFILGWLGIMLAAAVVSVFLPRTTQRELGLDPDEGSDGWFDIDDLDPEQREADRELKRITKLKDDPEAANAWQVWLAAERRREEARFVKRRARAGESRDLMKSYLAAIREELAADRSMLDAEDPEDSLHGQVRRLEEELAWAEAEFDRMEQGRGR